MVWKLYSLISIRTATLASLTGHLHGYWVHFEVSAASDLLESLLRSWSTFFYLELQNLDNGYFCMVQNNLVMIQQYTE